MEHIVADVWGRISQKELSARDSLVHDFYLCHISKSYDRDEQRALADEWDKQGFAERPLSDLWGGLSDTDKCKIRNSIKNPAVSMGHFVDGVFIDELQIGPLHLLERLEAGEFVGPKNETQLRRKIGDKVF